MNILKQLAEVSNEADVETLCNTLEEKADELKVSAGTLIIVLLGTFAAVSETMKIPMPVLLAKLAAETAAIMMPELAAQFVEVETDTMGEPASGSIN